jgi:hypothetical protein
MSLLVVTLALALDAPAPADAGAPPPVVRPPSPSLLAPMWKPPPPADRSYTLVRAKDGTGDLVYEAPGFTARIAPDGTPRFIDHRFTFMRPWSFVPFAPLPGPSGRPSLQGVVVDLLSHRKPGRGSPADANPPPAPVPLKPTMTPYRPDPAEACRYPRSCYFEAAVVLVGVGGTFDLTDELMRLAGEDPYRHEKAKFLSATTDLRGGLAARALVDNVRRASAALPATLEAIACDASRPVRERRAVIESLRQELDGDALAARAAAATITRFLETRFVETGSAGERVVRCANSP